VAKNNIQTAAGIKLIINGNVVGFATGFSLNRNQQLNTIYEIDNPLPAEIAPTLISVSGTLSGIRVRDNYLDENKIFDLSQVINFFTQKYVNITIEDMQTGKIIYNIYKAIFESDSISIENKKTITFNANFKAMFVFPGTIPSNVS